MRIRYFVKVRKLFGNPYVPAREFRGYTDSLPKFGKRFFLHLVDDPQGLEYLHTTEVESVKEIEEDGTVSTQVFVTKNSSYTLSLGFTEILPEES